MQHTGVKATDDEVQDLRNLAAQGWRSGDVMIVSSVMEGITKDQRFVDARIACHKLALSHGLPEIEGYYGIANDGEFVQT